MMFWRKPEAVVAPLEQTIEVPPTSQRTTAEEDYVPPAPPPPPYQKIEGMSPGRL
jgi:hypothetical protein